MRVGGFAVCGLKFEVKIISFGCFSALKILPVRHFFLNAEDAESAEER